VSVPLGQSLVPPRKNLGPEPWPEPSPLEPFWIFLAVSTSVLVASACWRLFGRARARSRPAGTTTDLPDLTPRGRLVALSNSTKNALAARFGASWRAKTTEELAAEPTLAEILGPEPLKELIEFLDRIDRLKFAVERPNQIRQPLEAELADWNPRIAGVIARIEARTNGQHEKPLLRPRSVPAPRR
jgi:hypothetical protein